MGHDEKSLDETLAEDSRKRGYRTADFRFPVDWLRQGIYHWLSTTRMVVHRFTEESHVVPAKILKQMQGKYALVYVEDAHSETSACLRIKGTPFKYVLAPHFQQAVPESRFERIRECSFVIAHLRPPQCQDERRRQRQAEERAERGAACGRWLIFGAITQITPLVSVKGMNH